MHLWPWARCQPVLLIDKPRLPIHSCTERIVINIDFLFRSFSSPVCVDSALKHTFCSPTIRCLIVCWLPPVPRFRALLQPSAHVPHQLQFVFSVQSTNSFCENTGTIYKRWLVGDLLVYTTHSSPRAHNKTAAIKFLTQHKTLLNTELFGFRIYYMKICFETV